eukprot:CAMPEP_0114476632 /NCGR_PEP_ID=MMETSP0104-20121206/14873_1 /TAXON_ID=37642 ORGANISM="Paraphysomonas imperforata, Strain PA2" /NCGR_SAMPLE_ID=MMETSP0104 /ASSEMBLY_ACC=CAM_ASM_000202 /LENGTH=52 /DNA_ID=CAMNT_0001651405 /DNA_START=15 /DNA_END=170 /DNA_ORIENTATION=-
MVHHTIQFQNNDKSRSLTVDLVSRHPESLYAVVGASIESFAVPVHALMQLID